VTGFTRSHNSDHSCPPPPSPCDMCVCVSDAGKECQTADWRGGHKSQCILFAGAELVKMTQHSAVGGDGGPDGFHKLMARLCWDHIRQLEKMRRWVSGGAREVCGSVPVSGSASVVCPCV
jgi:hypothetical protein